MVNNETNRKMAFFFGLLALRILWKCQQNSVKHINAMRKACMKKEIARHLIRCEIHKCLSNILQPPPQLFALSP